MSESNIRWRFRQERIANGDTGHAVNRNCGVGDDRAGFCAGTIILKTGSPARLRAGTPGSGCARHLLDSAGVVRSHDRCGSQSRLAVHGAETKDKRDQGEHMGLEFEVAASQHMPARWRRGPVAANATGSIVIARNERAGARPVVLQDC